MITVHENARDQVRRLMAEEGCPEGSFVRVGVNGLGVGRRLPCAARGTKHECFSLLFGVSGGHCGHCEVNGVTRGEGSLRFPPEGGAIHHLVML